MIGSETFIIVALRWIEKRTPVALASAICAVRNSRSFATRITVASTTSPASTGTASRRTVVVPSAATSSIRSLPASATVADRSFDRKSCSPIVATCVLESGDHGPIECGCVRAYCFTDAGARRSELPSRSTGLTALPLSRSYRARISRSASSRGSSGYSGRA